MKIRDRVKELRRVRAGDLRPHPKNWRTHSRHQQDVWRGVLREVGLADALLVRELPDGTLQLIDGHLRAAQNPSATMPVLVLDLDDDEAEKVLLTHDPLGALAGVDDRHLADLLESVQTEADPLREMFGHLSRQIVDTTLVPEPPEIDLTPSYQVVVEVDGEGQQREVYERMVGDGYRCRVLTL